MSFLNKINFNILNLLRSCLKTWRPYFIILVFGLLLYGRSLAFDFTYFDDNVLILDHAPILSSVRNIPFLFLTDAFMRAGAQFYYRPLLNLSFMLDAQVAGSSSFFYHLINVLIHCLATCLVFYLFNRLGGRRAWSFILSLIFLVHPVSVSAIVWIPGRNDSLLTVFILVAFIAFLNFLESPRLKNYLVFLFFFLTSLFIKESAIALIPLLIIYYFFVSQRKMLKQDKYLLLAGTTISVFLWLLMRQLAFSGSNINFKLVDIVMAIFKNWPGLILDLGKLIFPFNLSVLPILEDSILIYGYIALVIFLIATFFLSFNNRKLALFGWLWFILFLLPSFIRLNGQPDFLEHRMYLSLVGFLIFLLEIKYLSVLDYLRRPVSLSLILILLFFSTLSFIRSNYYIERLIFWRQAVSDSPHSPLAQRNFGAMLYFIGDIASAIKQYRIALKINPQEPMIHNNIGVIYMSQNKYKEADEEFRRELELNPDYDKALFNLGDLAYRGGKFSEALYYWRSALRSNPTYVDAAKSLHNLENQLR